MEPAWIGNSDLYDYDDRPSWRDLERRDKKIETIEDFFKGVLDELYGRDELDPARLEDYLEEIAYELNMKIPKRPMMLMRPQMNNN